MNLVPGMSAFASPCANLDQPCQPNISEPGHAVSMQLANGLHPVIMVPGIDGSDADHWQTLWQQDDPTIRRISPASWSNPELVDWERSISVAVRLAASRPVLIAHSLGTLAAASWVSNPSNSELVAGVVLVSVPDPEGESFPTAASGFVLTKQALAVPSLIVASTSDPFGTLEHQRRAARIWGSRLVDVGPFGHINSASGLGRWPAGFDLVCQFIGSLR